MRYSPPRRPFQPSSFFTCFVFSNVDGQPAIRVACAEPFTLTCLLSGRGPSVFQPGFAFNPATVTLFDPAVLVRPPSVHSAAPGVSQLPAFFLRAILFSQLAPDPYASIVTPQRLLMNSLKASHFA